MFAVYAQEPNAESPLDSLVVGERPEPDVPDGWVRVHVKAASLNMHDLWTLRGVGIKPDQFPMILGCDGGRHPRRRLRGRRPLGDQRAGLAG